MRVRFCGEGETAGESEVGDFDVALFVDQEVLGFDVAVEDSVGVQVGEALAQLLYVTLEKRKIVDLGRWNYDGRSNRI